MSDKQNTAPDQTQHLGEEDVTLKPVSDLTKGEATIALPIEGTQAPTPAILNSLHYFGDYELLHEIARGGMGVVYKAKQVNLNRIVALKMILSGQLAGKDDVLRFQTEAEAAAQLDHPGIVPIFEIGQHHGQHYFSMGFIEGQSLADLIADAPLPARHAATLVAKISDAIAYAHERGVIHRDLKPANVLLDQTGQPKVTDFGLAKRTETESGLTGTGQILGTPAYMPPEQASGRVEDIGPLADVYSLGAILYCTITGRPPFQAANAMDTLLQVLEKEPVAPRQLNPAIDVDLQTICLKALEKSPQKRYEGARELCDELHRYLNGEPIHARPIGRLDRARRWCKRKPALAGVIALAIVLLIMLSVGGPIIALQQANYASEQAALTALAEEARNDAEERRVEADAQRSKAIEAQQKVEGEQARNEGLLYATRISLAYREWLDGNPTRVQQLLHECPPDMRNWEWQYLDQLLRAEEMSIFAHDFPVSVQFSPSGNSLLTRGYRDEYIKTWDVATGLEERSLRSPQLTQVKSTFDEGHFLILVRDKLIYSDSQNTSPEQFGGFGTRATGGQLIAEGKRLAAAFSDGTIVIYERPGGKEIFRTPEKLESDRPHVFSPNGRLVVTTSDLTVKLFDVSSGTLKYEYDSHGWAITDICFNNDGTLLATSDRAGGLVVTEVATGKPLQHIQAHAAGITSLAFSHDGTRIATGSNDRTASVFDVQTGDHLLTVRGHTNKVLDVDFDPTGSQLATASIDGTVRVWQINQRLNIAPHIQDTIGGIGISHFGHTPGLDSRIFVNDIRPTYDVIFSPDGRYIASSSMTLPNTGNENSIQIWSTADSTLHTTLPCSMGFLHTLEFTSDSQTLIVASGGAGDGVSTSELTLWDLEEKNVIRRIEGVPCMFIRAALNQSNDILAVAFGNLNYGKIRTYSFPDCELLQEFDVKGERLSGLTFSASGDELFSSSTPGGVIHGWNARSGEQLFNFVAHGSGVFQIAVNTQDLLATANIDGVISLWNWHTQQKVGDLKGHSTYAVDITFSPDGKRLASSSEDETVKIWDLDHFTELMSFRDHLDAALGVDWSRDGKSIASTSRDGAMIVRNVSSTRAQDPIEEWTTLFQDDFERDDLGPKWSGTGWKIDNGKVVGTLQDVPLQGGSFPGAFLTCIGANLPRTFEVTAEVSLRQPMLAQIVLSNQRTSQYIAPFIASTTRPYGFIGSMVQVARGEGQENKIVGGRTEVQLQPETTYKIRVVRDIDQLSFYLDDRLLENVRVPTFETNYFGLSGTHSQVGDQIEFDNVSVRVPKHTLREQEIRTQVSERLATLLIPELVTEDIPLIFSDATDQAIAASALKQLSAGSTVTPAQILDAFAPIANRDDATSEQYEIAKRQAEYYFARNQERWQLGKVGMAFLRAGDAEQALKIIDRGIEENLTASGHGFGQLYAGRALALHALNRLDEARIEHRRFLDSNWTNLANQNPMPRLTRELASKVPLDDDPIRQTLINKGIELAKAYWYGGDAKNIYSNALPNFTRLQGRGPLPDSYDIQLTREQATQLDAIQSISNPPPKLQLLWENIEVDQPDPNTTTLSWISIAKFADSVFRFGQKYTFQLVEGEWKLAQERLWQMDRRINYEWEIHDETHFEQLDQQVEMLKRSQDPKLAETLLTALRFEDAFNVALQVTQQDPANAESLVALGEAAILLGRFDEGIEALEQARRIKPDAFLPWFLTRIQRAFADHPANPFDLDFHPTLPLMVTSHADKAIVIWDLEQQKIVQTIAASHGREATGTVFSTDGSKIFSVGFDAALNTFDTESGERIGQLSGHLGVIYRIEKHPHEDIVVTTSADGTAKIWDMIARQELVTLSGHTSAVMGGAFSEDGLQVATASADGTVRTWDTRTGRQLLNIDAHDNGAWRVDWTPDNLQLISCGRDRTVKVWNAEDGQLLASLNGHSSDIEVVRVSPDGAIAASADNAGEIWIWDLQKHQAIAVLRDDRANYNIRFHNGSLFSAGEDITQWDADFTTSPLATALQRLNQQ